MANPYSFDANSLLMAPEDQTFDVTKNASYKRTPAPVIPQDVSLPTQVDLETDMLSKLLQNGEYSRNQITRKTFATPKELEARLNSIRGMPEYKEGLAAQELDRDIMKKLAQMELPSTNAGVKQLLALADSETGSKLLAGYKEPTGMDDYAEKLLGYQSRVSKADKEKYSDLLKSAGGMETGYKTEIEGIGTGKKGANSGGKIIPAKIAMELGDAYNTPNRVDELISKIKERPDLMGNISAASNATASLFGMESEAAPLDMLIQSLRQDIGKMKEGGVLRLEDEKKYSKMLPSLRTNPETAINNLMLIRKELAEKVRSHYSGLKSAKYDVSGFNVTNEAVAPKKKSGLTDAEKAEKEALMKELGVK
jgi:hypothetical protein